MDDGIGPTIGQRLAQLRRGRMTQSDLAAAAGVSVDLVRKLEQGRRHTVSIGSLHRLARALDVDVTELLATPAGLPPAGPDSGAVAIRQALTSVEDLIDDDIDAATISVAEAQRTVAYGWGAYWGGRYELLGKLLPTAIKQLQVAVHGSTASDRVEIARSAAQVHEIAASTLVHLGYGDIAHLALREALQLARSGGDELMTAALRCSLAWVLLTQGRFSESHRLATATAAGLGPHDGSSPSAWTLYGSLLLTGATAAGRAGNRPVAGVLLDEAHGAARRTGNRFDYERAFGPDQVLMQTVDVEIVTERYDSALKAAQHMPARTALPLAAQARHLTDVALAHTRLGNESRALDTLLSVESLAPDWLRYQAQPRQIVREIRARSARPARLTELAERLGV